MKLGLTIAAVATAGMLAAGCTTTEQTTAAGALIGGGAAAVAGGNTGQIIAGTAVGAGAGLLVGTLANGNCRYRNPDGSTYIARCP
ncbi:MAG: hypothetical protein JJ920_19685 [Roseitalea sp.]|jgi:hypothetical protein|nr:hypothetical protein [Roseitalea sp.]MBO6722572.1 hypothetical protein [Roseitalea sp.]MBO6745139.1 hypothetical protein [Roseitalea sp.]